MGLYSGRIVTEWMPRGFLARMIGNGLSPTQKMKIALGIAKGMAHTHQCVVIHRDLKPNNILLDDNIELDSLSENAQDLLRNC
jgi:serine/threonine protein kinase